VLVMVVVVVVVVSRSVLLDDLTRRSRDAGD